MTLRISVLPARAALPGGLFCIYLMLVACGRDAELPRLAEDAVIVAFGDSLTFGTGAEPDESYPAVLSLLTGRRVINAGVPGEVSGDGLKRLPRELEKHRPALIILCHGGNDFLRKMDTGQTAENVAAMIRLAQEHGAAVVLLGVPRPGLFLNAAEFYEDSADANGAVYLEDVVPDVLSETDLKSDAVHPNAAGYREIAERILAALRDAGSV